MLELEVEEICPSLRFATAKVAKANRSDAATAGTGRSAQEDEPPF